MSDDYIQSLMPLILKAGFGLQAGRCMTVATYTLQVYEWLICFSDEYLYVHKARWSSVKIAYLFCRYYPLFVFPFHVWAFVGNHPLSVCEKVLHPALLLLTFFPMSAQAVFIIRTYAFSGRNKLILTFLVTCWIGLFVAIIYVHTTKFTLFDEWHIYFGEMGCFGVADTTGASEVSWAHSSLIGNAVFQLCTFALDTFMTVIVLIRCIRLRSMNGPLGKVFVSQGLLAYVTLSVVNLALAFVFFGTDRRWDNMATLNVVFSDVIACRLILMLRRRADPTPTMQDRQYSEIVRDAVGRMRGADHVFLSGGSSERNQKIENWD